jgi:hypothetical protein
VKTILMDVAHFEDTLDGADWAALEVTQGMAAELLVLIARFRKIQGDEEKLSSIIYRDLYIPTFFVEWDESGGFENNFNDLLGSFMDVDGFQGKQDGVIVLDGRLEIPLGPERLLEYPKLWVLEDRVFWRGSYRHEEVYAETAPLMRETLQQIAGVIKCP